MGIYIGISPSGWMFSNNLNYKQGYFCYFNTCHSSNKLMPKPNENFLKWKHPVSGLGETECGQLCRDPGAWRPRGGTIDPPPGPPNLAGRHEGVELSLTLPPPLN